MNYFLTKWYIIICMYFLDILYLYFKRGEHHSRWLLNSIKNDLNTQIILKSNVTIFQSLILCSHLFLLVFPFLLSKCMLFHVHWTRISNIRLNIHNENELKLECINKGNHVFEPYLRCSTPPRSPNHLNPNYRRNYLCTCFHLNIFIQISPTNLNTIYFKLV